MYKYLLLLSFLIIIGCSAQGDTTHAPTEKPDYATVVEVKDAKTYEGILSERRDVTITNQNQKGAKIMWSWHAKIEIVFSKTPINLDILGLSAKHTFDLREGELIEYYWEQTGNIVTIYLEFNAEELLEVEGTLLTYEEVSRKYPKLNMQNFIAYWVEFTLDWDTGRKRYKHIEIKPSKQILDRYKE